MEDEDLVLPSMYESNSGEELELPSMVGVSNKKPSVPKLPANLNPQQVKRFFSQAGKTITDTEARELAGMVSGKS